MGGIFDDSQPMLFRKRQYGLHITSIAAVMHDNDGACFISQAIFNGLDRNRQILFTNDIGKNWDGPRVTNSVGGCDKRQRWDDDFVSGANAAGQAGKMQSGGGVVDSNRMARTDHLGEFFFKGLRDRAHGQPAAA